MLHTCRALLLDSGADTAMHIAMSTVDRVYIVPRDPSPFQHQLVIARMLHNDGMKFA